MALFKRGEIYWLDISIRGRPRIRETTGLTDRQQAQELHDRRKALEYDTIRSGKTLGDAIKLWLKIEPRNSRETSAIKTFLKIYPNRPLADISGLDIHDALMCKNPANANRIANTIRAAINLAATRKWCKEVQIPKREEKKPVTAFLQKNEWEVLKQHLQPHVLAMATFALATGLRLSNVTQLQWVNVNLEKRFMWVDAKDAKGNKIISVPLSNIAMEVLQSQVGKHGAYVFIYNNKPIKSAKTSWNKSLVKAGIKLVPSGKKDNQGNDIMKSAFRWHDLRHTWASWHILNGTPLKALKELGGWSDLKLVDRYSHLSPEHIRQYVDNF
jgi:integrase